MNKTKRTILTDIGSVIDQETGEIIESSSDHYRITIEEFLTNDVEESMKYFMPDITFIKSFRGNGIMLDKKLTNSELAATVFLSDFICYNDCVLRKNGDKRGSALSIRDLAELRGVKYDSFRRTMYSLRDKEVIGFHDTGDENGTHWITVNPFIFCRGVKISVWVIDFYADTEWAKIERQRIKENREKEVSDE